MNWKDTTSHSQRETPEQYKIVRESTLDTGKNFRIVVHRHRDYEDTTWLVTTHPLLVERQVISQGGSIEVAQALALELVRKRLQQIMNALT